MIYSLFLFCMYTYPVTIYYYTYRLPISFARIYLHPFKTCLHITCLLKKETPVVQPSGNPCVPSPCGPNSQCRAIGETPACSCLLNYVGRSPNCRPECSINSECPSNLACVNERCIDPCPGSCGALATCTVSNHRPICTCIPGYTGDPFRNCNEIPRSKLYIKFRLKREKSALCIEHLRIWCIECILKCNLWLNHLNKHQGPLRSKNIF